MGGVRDSLVLEGREEARTNDIVREAVAASEGAGDSRDSEDEGGDVEHV